MAKTKNLLSRKQKLFKMDSVLPLDANNLDVEEAISRLFVYLRTNGRQITRTDKPIFTGESDDSETPKAVVKAIVESNSDFIQGMEKPERQELISSWLESHFALMARRGKSKGPSVPTWMRQSGEDSLE